MTVSVRGRLIATSSTLPTAATSGIFGTISWTLPTSDAVPGWVLSTDTSSAFRLFNDGTKPPDTVNSIIAVAKVDGVEVRKAVIPLGPGAVESEGSTVDYGTATLNLTRTAKVDVRYSGSSGFHTGAPTSGIISYIDIDGNNDTLPAESTIELYEGGVFISGNVLQESIGIGSLGSHDVAAATSNFVDSSIGNWDGESIIGLNFGNGEVHTLDVQDLLTNITASTAGTPPVAGTNAKLLADVVGTGFDAYIGYTATNDLLIASTSGAPAFTFTVSRYTAPAGGGTGGGTVSAEGGISGDGSTGDPLKQDISGATEVTSLGSANNNNLMALFNDGGDDAGSVKLSTLKSYFETTIPPATGIDVSISGFDGILDDVEANIQGALNRIDSNLPRMDVSSPTTTQPEDDDLIPYYDTSASAPAIATREQVRGTLTAQTYASYYRALRASGNLEMTGASNVGNSLQVFADFTATATTSGTAMVEASTDNRIYKFTRPGIFMVLFKMSTRSGGDYTMGTYLQRSVNYEAGSPTWARVPGGGAAENLEGVRVEPSIIVLSQADIDAGYALRMEVRRYSNTTSGNPRVWGGDTFLQIVEVTPQQTLS